MSGSLVLGNREGSEVESAYLSSPISPHLDNLSFGLYKYSYSLQRVFYCQGDF